VNIVSINPLSHHGGLGDQGRLVGLIGRVGGNSLCLDLLLCLIIFLVRPEKIDIIIIVSCGGSNRGCSGTLGELFATCNRNLGSYFKYQSV
jgi:hypothetical protein